MLSIDALFTPVNTYIEGTISTSAQDKIQFKFFLKEYKFFGFPCCSTRENLSIHASITAAK